MVSKLRLYGEDGIVTVRDAKTIADAPASGTWSPDNLNAAEIAASVVADDVTLDAREWETVNLFADFVDGAGAPHAGGSVDVTLLLATPDGGASTGRRWKERMFVEALTGSIVMDVPVDGHDVAFRADVLDLNGATSVLLKVTGGRRLRAVLR